MHNQIIKGDCLDVMTKLPSNHVHLIYLDPPFFTQKTHSLKSKNLEEYQFEDKWEDIQDYVTFLRLRLHEMKRVMRDDASIYFHCDRHASHYIRVLLDEVFGYGHFMSEIIWTYRRWSNAQKNLLPSHQTIYWYRKSTEYQFYPEFQSYSQTTNLDQIFQRRKRNEFGKTKYDVNEDGTVIINGPKKGVPLSDVWEIPYLNPKASERIGYPTQKPILLLERIINLSTRVGDIVLDPFCGSGTTCVAAELLGREFIGIDIADAAIKLCLERLQNPIRTRSNLLENGIDQYIQLPDYVNKILAALPVQPVQRNSGIDALYKEYVSDKPVTIRIQRHEETIEEAASKLKRSSIKLQAKNMILIQTHQQPSMFKPETDDSIIVIDSLGLIIATLLKLNI